MRACACDSFGATSTASLLLRWLIKFEPPLILFDFSSEIKQNEARARALSTLLCASQVLQFGVTRQRQRRRRRRRRRLSAACPRKHARATQQIKPDACHLLACSVPAGANSSAWRAEPDVAPGARTHTHTHKAHLRALAVTRDIGSKRTCVTLKWTPAGGAHAHTHTCTLLRVYIVKYERYINKFAKLARISCTLNWQSCERARTRCSL